MGANQRVRIADAAAFAAQGVDAQVFDGSTKLPQPERLAAATHLLISAPAEQGGGDPVLRQHASDIAARHGLHWIGYLSTVGVYGDAAGAAVDETSPLRPHSERAHLRVQAERMVQRTEVVRAAEAKARKEAIEKKKREDAEKKRAAAAP